MEKSVQKYIENSTYLIETENFEDLYALSIYLLEPKAIGKLTETFLDAGIDPLIQMKEIPKCYLYYGSVSEFQIPQGIQIISESAFKYSDLVKIYIPKSIKAI